MKKFRQENLANIKTIFAQKTEVCLEAKRRQKKWQLAAAAAAILCLCSLSAYAVSLFSSLEGDELAFSAEYKGEGVVQVTVENFSAKELHLQKEVKLKRWNSGDDVGKTSNNNIFNGADIAPGEKQVIYLDLTKSYDVALLEQPLTDDWYYLVFTNNNFAFGQDWMCSIFFTDAEENAAEGNEASYVMEPEILANIDESLQGYFAADSFDITTRESLENEYIADYERLLAKLDGEAVKAIEAPLQLADPEAGVIFDENIAADKQYLLTGLHWQSHDVNFKLLATAEEKALCLSVMVPSERYADTGSELPLFYILTYDRQESEGEDKYAFIYGKIYSFADLAEYLIYEDEQYVCYEVGALVYGDWAQYSQSFAKRHGDLRTDEQSMKRIENFYSYYKENLGRLISVR